jgi:hypothetical protein
LQLKALKDRTFFTFPPQYYADLLWVKTTTFKKKSSKETGTLKVITRYRTQLLVHDIL